MDCSLDENERALYRVWLHSPSVFGTEVETILAFKIAREIQGIPSRVLKALRGEAGVDPGLLAQVEAFVAADDTLVLIQDAGRRRIALAEDAARAR